MSLLRRVPWWFWVAVLVAGAFFVQEIRIRRALTAADEATEARFHDAIEQIETEREAQEQALGALQADRTREKAELLKDSARVAEAAARSAVSGAAVAKDKRVAEDLAAHPTAEAVARAAEALGVKVRIVPRRQP